MRKRFSIAAVLCLAAGSAAAHGSVDVVDCVNPGPDPARFYSGLGNTRAPVLFRGEKGALAQRYFNQGLIYVYAFNKPEAINSFVAASKADPAAPMAWWGIALAAGPDINTAPLQDCLKLAADAIDRAAKLAGARKVAPGDAGQAKKEDALIAATRVRFRRKAGVIEIDARAYSDALARVAAAYPEDHHIATVYASALLNISAWHWWKDGELTPEASLARGVLRNVLALEPGHVGANHYFIHSTEQAPDPAEALPSADRMATLTPGAGHILHMPAHIYRRMGMHARATAANYLAVAADRAYVDQTPETAQYPLRYMNHNLHFLTFSLIIEGRASESVAAAHALFENTKRFTGNTYNALHNQTIVTSRDELFFTVVIAAIIRNKAWESDLARNVARDLPPIVEKWDLTVAAAFAAYADIRRQLDSGAPDPKALGAAFETFWTRAAAVAPGTGFDNNSAAVILRLANLDALGRSLERLEAGAAAKLAARARMRMAEIPALAVDRGVLAPAGDLPIAVLKHAVAVEDGMNYAEPPNWYYPMREALGGALYRAGRYEEATAVFRKGLELYRGYPRMAFGLIESLTARGRAVPDWLAKVLAVGWVNATAELSMEAL